MRILGLVSIALVLLLGGCTPARKDASGMVQLRFSCLGAKQESDLANALARAFEAKHPNIKITIEPVAGMGYDIKRKLKPGETFILTAGRVK